MKKIIFITFIIVITFIAGGGQVRAQSLSLGIWPPLLEVIIQPGKSITQVYKLSNLGDTDLVLTSRIVSFSPEDEQGTPKLNLETEKDYLNWFSFQNADLKLQQPFVLKAGSTQEVVLKIKIPPDVAEGDYYSTLLFETVQVPGMYLTQSGGQVEAKIGGNILLTVSQSGKPKKQVQISQFSIDNPQFKIRNWIIIDSFTRPRFIVRLKNTGQAFFKPNGTITTTGWFGQKWELNLLPENVLVNSTREIRCQGESFKLENDKEKLNYSPAPCQLPTKFLLGKYQAILKFNLDDQSEEYQSKLVFWALPVKLILGIVVCLALLIIIFQKVFLNKKT